MFKRSLSSLLLVASLLVSSFASAQVQEEFEVNVARKLKECEQLVKKAVTFFKNHTIAESGRAFVEDKAWRKGEIGILLFDEGGVCYTFGKDRRHIWRDFQSERTMAEEDFIPEMLEVGKEGGFVNWKVDNGYMQTYVKRVVKQGKTYLIAAGFFPSSDRYITEQLVKTAVKWGSAMTGKDHTRSARQLFDQISNPYGIFRRGGIYLYVYDMEGNVVAHGESVELIGSNVIDEQTSDKKYRTRDLIKIAKSSEGHGWYTYQARQGNATKIAYAERYIDPATNKMYVIVAGYYPNIDDSTVQTFVKKAATYLRVNGSEKALPEFSKRLGDFVYGDVSIFVYNTTGVMLADSANQAFIGLNLMSTRDQAGKYITKLILEYADKYPSGSWLGFTMRNAHSLMYVEKVKIPDGDFIVGASYFPSSKYVYVRFMVDNAIQFLKAHPREDAFNMFVNGDPEFLRGDLQVFIIDETGAILVDGPNRQAIWSDSTKFKDEKDRSISDRLLAIAKSGGGWFEHKVDNGIRRAFVKLLTKEATQKGEEPETFVVGSFYYL